MPKSIRKSSTLLGVPAALLACVTLAAAPSASAAPITVNIRVEGSTSTLYEGPISTEAETITTPSGGGGPHPCNYAENGQAEGHANEGSKAGTPTTALHDAASASGLAFDAEWFGSGMGNANPGDFFVHQVGSDINQASAPYASWGYAVNDTTAPVGGCQIALAPGNSVLWAYNYFNLLHLLSLNGPPSASAGVPFTVHVVDGQTGQPISGAAVGAFSGGVTSTSASSPITDAAGNVTITLGQTGTQTLKATREDSVRSNAIAVCVHNGNDGNCGTTTPGGSIAHPVGSTGPPPGPAKTDVAKVLGVRGNHVYARRRAPRLLGGSVVVPAGATLSQVRISLQRRYRGHCLGFSGRLERFVKAKCHTRAFFSVGSAASFSYLLPARLPAGSYTYDIEAVDSAGHVTGLASGVSQVRFDVR